MESLSSDASLSEFVAKGLFGDAAKWIDRRRDLTVSDRVVRAQLEVHVGTPARAREMAHTLLKERLTNKDSSNCWELVGRVCLNVGELEDGLRAMSQAFTAAAATHDLQVEARLRSSYVHSLLQWVGTEAAAVEIPKLRQVAVRAGDAYALIAVHSLAAEINARKGQVKSALASISVASELLGRFDNVWQRGRLAIVCFGVSMLQSDYESASQSNKEALSCATRSGSREIRIPALGNLAFIKIAQHEFQDVKLALNELINELQKGGTSIAEIGARDIEMESALAANDLTSAAALESLITNLISIVEPKDSYYELWHLLNRVRWLYRLGRADEGVSVAIDAIPRIARTSDRNLLERMKLLAAEGYGRIGQAARGASLIASAAIENPDSSLEMTGEAFRVTGRLAALEDRGSALSHFKRAARIFESIGNLTARAQVQRDVFETLAIGLESAGVADKHTDKHSPNSSPLTVADLRAPAAPLTERISTFVEIGTHAPLLASESLSLLGDTDTVLSASIVTTDVDGRRAILATYLAPGVTETLDDHPNAIRIPIGTHRQSRYEIVALPLSTASARATVLSVERLVNMSLALARARQLERERTALWPEQTPEQQLGLICASERMLDLVKTVRRVAASNVTVLLTGETGVGKELFARALHQASPRNEKVFLPFNCSTVPREMFDSQLFGHKRGSFTGAVDDSAGMIRSAAGGTLFLDEIGEMALDTQPKLLRFLESGEIMPLGDPRPQLVDVRLVAATNANLDQLVADGRFREDLFYRLNVIRINIPSLRERREEIPALVEHFLERYAGELQKPQLRIADETLEYLVLYRWPGNVRQLANEIRRMVAMAEPGAVLMPAHLSDAIAASRRTIPTERPPLHSTEVMTRLDQPLSAAVEHIERAAIQRAVAVAEGNLIEAAKMLGLSRKGLYLKRQRLGLE